MTTVLAATLPGDGTHNQDAYACGDGWAVVADGATSFAGDRSHDPGWYAQQLVQALAHALPCSRLFPADDLRDVLAGAIRTVRDTHGLTPTTAPSATVAVARWTIRTVQVCVLGDAIAALLYTDGTEHVITDARIGTVATEQRTTARAHLARHGHDDQARNLLADLQAEEARHRNQPGGYWVASDDPDAAQHAISHRTFRGGVLGLVLATDGVALDRHPDARTWHALYDEASHDPARTLRRINEAEDGDPCGRQWARTKVHDDKTLVAVPLPLDPASLGPGVGEDFGDGWTIDRIRTYSGVPTAEALSLDRDVYEHAMTDYERLEPQAIISFDGLFLVRHDGEWWMGTDDDGAIVCWGSYGPALAEAIDAL